MTRPAATATKVTTFTSAGQKWGVYLLVVVVVVAAAAAAVVGVVLVASEHFVSYPNLFVPYASLTLTLTLTLTSNSNTNI